MILLAAAAFAAPSPAAAADPPHDRAVANAVETELLHDNKAALNDIDVKVSEGIVTLEGESPHILGKQRASRIAETVKGVRAVVNLLEVRPRTAVSAPQLKKDVKDALFADPAAESYELNVSADDDGAVTVSGRVDSWEEKQLAVQVVKGVRGVTGVVDRIRVNHRSDRTDAEIIEEIKARLAWNTLVDASLVNLTVNDGKVTLTGTVGSAAEKRQARYNAWTIPGVIDVDDSRLKIDRSARDKHLRTKKYVPKSDAQIRDALEDALQHHPRVASFDITPEVANKVVTLRGTVDNLKAKHAARQVARHTVGVRRVHNFIRVRLDDPISDSEIRSNVLRNLARDPLVETLEINVEVRSGAVHLRGTVDTLAEKMQAEDVAARTHGVTTVANHLLVSDAEDVRGFNPRVWSDGWSYYPRATPGTDRRDPDAGIKQGSQSPGSHPWRGGPEKAALPAPASSRRMSHSVRIH